MSALEAICKTVAAIIVAGVVQELALRNGISSIGAFIIASLVSFGCLFTEVKK